MNKAYTLPELNGLIALVDPDMVPVGAIIWDGTFVHKVQDSEFRKNGSIELFIGDGETKVFSKTDKVFVVLYGAALVREEHG